MRLLQRTVQFLVLYSKALQPSVTNQLLQHLQHAKPYIMMATVA